MASDPPLETDARYRAIAQAIEHLIQHRHDQPALAELAAAAGLSPWHFQRVFTDWAGLSPKRFLQYLTVSDAKRRLAADASVLDTALEVGLSGPSRLHDLFIACEAMTPGEYKQRGRSLTIRWGVHATPFGRAVLAATERGLCWLGFVVGGDAAATIAAFHGDWADATRVEDRSATASLVPRVFGTGDGAAPAPLRLHLRGTNFQIKVWEALLAIPSGAVVSYQDVARAIGRPAAVRAVGHAVGRNPISYIIPCHRVILKSGVIHNYRWDPARKEAVLAFEALRRAADADPVIDAVGAR